MLLQICATGQVMATPCIHQVFSFPDEIYPSSSGVEKLLTALLVAPTQPGRSADATTGVQQNAALWAAMAVALNAAMLLAAAFPLGAGAKLLIGGALRGGSLAEQQDKQYPFY